MRLLGELHRAWWRLATVFAYLTLFDEILKGLNSFPFHSMLLVLSSVSSCKLGFAGVAPQRVLL